MIKDLNTLPDGSALECDVCIVGSGAAGLCLAEELRQTKLSLVVLESGAMAAEPPTQALYECDISAHAFVGATEGRNRIHGGSTTIWGGQSLPLEEIDFAPREWVAHSGWPLRRGELESYYQRAAAFMMTDLLNFDSDVFGLLKFEPPAFDPAIARYHFSKWSPRPNLRDTYGVRLREAANVTLVFHANVTRIALRASHDRVEEITAMSLDGKSLRVRPRHLVLCTGGIETARILLANDAQQKRGIGNDRDLVGRFFQDHPSAPVGVVESDDPDELQRLFNTFYHRGLKYAPRFSMAAEFQRSQRVMNASALLSFDAGADSPYQRLKTAMADVRGGRLGWGAMKGIMQAAVHVPSVMRPVWRYAVGKRAYAPHAVVRMSIFSEQEPNPESRVLLSQRTDALGMRRADVRWELTELSRRTVAVYARALREEFARLGLGRVVLEPWLAEHGAGVGWQEELGDINHHMGATRMSDSAESGVVDRHGWVHGIENLAIASSSVFPTGGHSNPTLTLLALTIRMGEELKRRLGAEGREI